MSSKKLGILGGLGPMATVYFYELVTMHTPVQKDQDHIDIIISSRATTPDRSAFILKKSTEDPLCVMKAEAKCLAECGAEVLAIPCNTAHYFYEEISHAVNVPVLNMIDETVKKAKQLGCKKLGILATEGTVASHSYQIACKAAGLDCEVPGEKSQAAINHVIFENIKKGQPAEMPLFEGAANELFGKGCELIALACTELSLIKKSGLIGKGYIDSMDILAQLAISACGKTPVGFE